MGKYHSIFHFFSLILSVSCCISFGNSGCSSPGATLGGRLVFTGQSGQDVAKPPAWVSSRKLVFVTANFPYKRSLGSGRGRIWIGKRGCQGDFCQSTYLNSDGNLPCFEDLVDKANDSPWYQATTEDPSQTSETPCSVHEEDVLLNLTTPNVRRGRVVMARWQIQDRQASCGTIKKFLSVESRDLDGCPTHSSERIELNDLGDEARNRKILTDRKPNSLYKVTLSVAYGEGEFYNISKEIRTLETEPTLAPENLRVEVVGSGTLKFEWTKPPCGGCNGFITKYETSFTLKGREYKDKTEATWKSYFGLKEGDRYTFKVKAENRYARGPYTEPGCTSVFGVDRC